MIDVPVEVKDALREGTYRKNYRMQLFDNVDVDYFDAWITLYDEDTFTITESGKYRFYNGSYYGSFTVTYTENGTTTTILEHVGSAIDEGVEVVAYLNAVQNSGYYTFSGYSYGMELQKYSYTQSEYLPEKIQKTYNWTFGTDGIGQSEPLISGDYWIYMHFTGNIESTTKFWKVKPNGQEFLIGTYYPGYSNLFKAANIEDGDIIKAQTSESAAASAYSEAIGTCNVIFDNNNLVAESVNIDERLCSDEVLKFGLCEGSSLEFQYFDFGNINGKQIRVFLDVEYKLNQAERGWYTIPMGYFIVNKISRQASTGIMKVTAYNKLMSDYLDAKANELLQSNYVNPNQVITAYDVEDLLLRDYGVFSEAKQEVEISRSTSGVGIVKKLNGNAITFKAKYGINTPLSYYMYDNTSNPGSAPTSAYPFICASESATNLDSSKAYRIQFVYDMEALEQRYYDEIERLMTLSFNVTSDYMDRFMLPNSTFGGGYAGWQQFCGIRVTYADESKKWYSTIAYERGISGVVGTFKDLEKITLVNCTKIEFFLPYSLYFNNTTYDDGNYSLSFNFIDHSAYRYYTNSGYSFSPYQYYTWLTPDGNPVDYTWTVSGWAKCYEYTNLSPAEKIRLNPVEMADFSLRDILTAIYETQCQYGQLDRETDLFSGVELNQSRLYPQDALYPATNLYPGGAATSGIKSMYEKLWADEGNIHKWRYLIITYKGLDENNQEKDFVLQRTINADGTDNYNMSDNWLFRNLVWAEEDVGAYADAMVAKMRDITWFPFEMWAAGLPYLETGDEIEIPLGNDTYTSYILQRQLKGIQNLQDTYINGTLDIF